MKHSIIAAVIAASLLACNTDTTTTNKTDTSNHAAYSASEGDVSYRNGKLMIWKGGEWKETDNDVHLDNGVVVNRKGEVVKEDKVVVLHDGEVVDKSGRFFDKAGNAIEDAWDATKKGVKKAGEEVKDVFTDDDRNETKDKDKKD
jgi:hypothetical protein